MLRGKGGGGELPHKQFAQAQAAYFSMHAADRCMHRIANLWAHSSLTFWLMMKSWIFSMPGTTDCAL
jgi:hypothetical protein